MKLPLKDKLTCEDRSIGCLEDIRWQLVSSITLIDNNLKHLQNAKIIRLGADKEAKQGKLKGKVK